MESYGVSDGHEHEITRGQAYLEMLGLSHLASHSIETTSHGVIQAHQFMEVCGDQAGPFLENFRQMDPNHPKYDLMKSMLRRQVVQQIGINETEV